MVANFAMGLDRVIKRFFLQKAIRIHVNQGIFVEPVGYGKTAATYWSNFTAKACTAPLAIFCCGVAPVNSSQVVLVNIAN